MKELKYNKIKLYGYWFFHNLILAYVIERLFWEQRGISIQEVVYLEIIYAFVVSIFEIPTGYLADRFSRKGMMILGAIGTCLEFGILIFADNFLEFTLAIVFAALSGALMSGTSNSLLYDSMKLLGEEANFEDAVSKVRFFDGLASALAALMGGVVAVNLGLLTNYHLSLISTIIALIISFTFVEPKVKSEIENSEENSIKKTITFLKNNLSVVVMILNGIVISSTLIYVDEFWQIYLRDIHFPIALNGVVILTIGLVGSIAGLLTMRIKNTFGYRGSIFFSLICYCVGLLGLGLLNNIYGIIFILVVYFPTRIMETLVQGYIHHHAESDFRATAESVASLLHRVVSIVIGLLFGFIATKYAVFQGYLFLGLVIILFIILYQLFIKGKIEEETI